jgi:hypothetical protein
MLHRPLLCRDAQERLWQQVAGKKSQDFSNISICGGALPGGSWAVWKRVRLTLGVGTDVAERSSG